jgi:hypothetical protein
VRLSAAVTLGGQARLFAGAQVSVAGFDESQERARASSGRRSHSSGRK